jgi:hypothetical protein
VRQELRVRPDLTEDRAQMALKEQVELREQLDLQALREHLVLKE